MTDRIAWMLAAVASGITMTILVALRLQAAAADGLPDPQSLVWVLAGAAALCIAGLTYERAPSIGWIAIVLATAIATLGIAAFGREHRTAMDPAGWRWLVVLTCLGAVTASIAAAAYCTASGRKIAHWVVPVAWIAVVAVALAATWATATVDDAGTVSSASPIGSLGLVTRTLIVAVTTMLTLGVAGDLRPAVQRTRTRLGEHGDPPRVHDRLLRANKGLVIFAEEIAPGHARARRAATAERARIAVELHGDVVPAVRRALSEAEHGGSPERLAVALRDVLGELDDLAADRRSIVLDELGLLAAVEWLAERTEERSEVRVTIDVPGTAVAGSATQGLAARPPRSVESAAFRIAQLALENVVRHAPHASATVEVTAEPSLVRLAVADDGPGIPRQDPRSAMSGRRGLADMRSEAAACGASLTTGPGLGGHGTVICFAWPAP